MPLFTREDMELLLSPHPRPCVSLFLPTHRHHPGTDQDPIRFKNLLRRAAELLAEGHGPKAARELLDPLEALATPLFWSHQKDGLAIFRSSDLLVHYRLPLALEELVVVADSFHVRPVASFLQSHRRFYVLALAQKSIALAWHGGRGHARAVENAGGQRNPLAHVRRFRQPDRSPGGSLGRGVAHRPSPSPAAGPAFHQVRGLRDRHQGDLAADISLAEASREHFARTGYGGYPVVRAGRAVGLLCLRDVLRVPPEEQEATSVQAAMAPLGPGIVSEPTVSLKAAVARMAEQNAGRLLVLDGDRLVGLLTLNTVMRHVRVREQLRG